MKPPQVKGRSNSSKGLKPWPLLWSQEGAGKTQHYMQETGHHLTGGGACEETGRRGVWDQRTALFLQKLPNMPGFMICHDSGTLATCPLRSEAQDTRSCPTQEVAVDGAPLLSVVGWRGTGFLRTSPWTRLQASERAREQQPELRDA